MIVASNASSAQVEKFQCHEMSSKPTSEGFIDTSGLTRTVESENGGEHYDVFIHAIIHYNLEQVT